MIDIVKQIRIGEVDVNNQQNFFSTIIKGLLLNLNKEISIRGISVPHFILHTGDDVLYQENKNKDYSGTSIDVTNENYIYNTIPRCIVNPGGIDFATDQLTSPNTLGQLQMVHDNVLYNLVGEMRRMPIKLGVELEYYLDTFTDMLELVQQIASKMAFIRTYKIVYLGQFVTCSYKIPESYNGEWMTELDGTTQDNRARKVTLSLELESNFPIWDNKTIMDPSNYISGSAAGLNLHATDHLKEEGPVTPYENIPYRKS